jgi:hypothetical protein
LAYFLGLGYDSRDMTNVIDFHLTWRGYMLAFCLLFGFPILFAYRSFLAKKKHNQEL